MTREGRGAEPGSGAVAGTPQGRPGGLQNRHAHCWGQPPSAASLARALRRRACDTEGQELEFCPSVSLSLPPSQAPPVPHGGPFHGPGDPAASLRLPSVAQTLSSRTAHAQTGMAPSRFGKANRRTQNHSFPGHTLTRSCVCTWACVCAHMCMHTCTCTHGNTLV